jgi:hypothetical protein
MDEMFYKAVSVFKFKSHVCTGEGVPAPAEEKITSQDEEMEELMKINCLCSL